MSVGPPVVHVPRGRPLAHRLLLAREGLHVEVLEIADHGRVEPVRPDHGRLALVAVIVPRHGGGDHEVTAPHHALVALDGGERALAVEHEAHGVRRVAMGRRHLAGEQVLDGHGDRVGRRPLGHAGVVETEDAALGAAAGLHELGAPVDERLDLRPAPEP